MRVIIQRVKESSVTIGGCEKSKIGKGLLILSGFENADTIEDLEWMTSKVTQLRIFDDENGIMNRSVLDIDGEILVVSQFTLHAKTKKGNRPSYINAAKPEISVPLYEQFVGLLKSKTGKKIKTGEFGAMMDVGLVNDGPVTIFMDTKNKDL